MWTAWLLLMLNGLFFTLRLANNTGSFPRALTREEGLLNTHGPGGQRRPGQTH